LFFLYHWASSTLAVLDAVGDKMSKLHNSNRLAFSLLSSAATSKNNSLNIVVASGCVKIKQL
jgi:hypothetical protein